jgi:hypothetical protein
VVRSAFESHQGLVDVANQLREFAGMKDCRAAGVFATMMVVVMNLHLGLYE